MALPPQGAGAAPDHDGALSATLQSVSGPIATITAPDYSDDRPFDCAYLAPAGVPSPGDTCVVIFDERGVPLALFPGAGP
jgi:hypothetical protein